MMNDFLLNARSGKNSWWRYLLTFLSFVAAVAIANVLLQWLMPQIKAIVPQNNEFVKNIFFLVSIGIIFGFALLVFGFTFVKLHQRKFMSLVNTTGSFSWSLYFKGFILYSIIGFLVNLLTEYKLFQVFMQNFNFANFVLIFIVGFIFIGIQSFFEEILLRGYILQGLSLKIKKTIILICINGAIFALLHLGYGLGGFISSFAFGITFALITIWQNRIEFSAGVHNANNLILGVFFVDLNEELNAKFQWSINWMDLSLELISFAILLIIVYKFLRKNNNLSKSIEPISETAN
jgi:membrane protease YdiL (CAAX protease family)